MHCNVLVIGQFDENHQPQTRWQWEEMVPKALSRNPCNLSWKWESKRCGQVASFTTFHNLHLNFQTSCAQRATKTRKKLKRSKWATSTLCKMCCGDPAPLKQSKPLSILGVALGCRASAIIYRKTRVYGDYQWIIAINATTRQLTLQPIATSRDDKALTKTYFIWFKKSSLMTMARKGGMRVKGSLRTSCRALLTRLTFGERRSVSKRPWRPLWLQWYQRRPRPGHLILIVASPGIHRHSIGFITSQLHFGRKWATLHCWFVLN